MNSNQIKDILTQVTKPSEFTLVYDSTDTEYWLFKVSNVRLRMLNTMFNSIRAEDARIDVFIDGKYVTPADYHYMVIGRDFYVKFIKGSLNDPTNNTVVIKGDVEIF